MAGLSGAGQLAEHEANAGLGQGLTVLLLPGWPGGGTGDWPEPWAQRDGCRVVEQNDRLRPRRGDWLARLDEVVIDAPGPVVLVAHSLACILVAAWASLSQHTGKVRAALLVSPLDVAACGLPETLPGWQPIVRQPLPFRSMVVGSGHGPHGRVDWAQALARDWSAQWLDQGSAGHTTDDSSLGDWPQGHALLRTLLKD